MLDGKPKETQFFGLFDFWQNAKMKSYRDHILILIPRYFALFCERLQRTTKHRVVVKTQPKKDLIAQRAKRYEWMRVATMRIINLCYLSDIIPYKYSNNPQSQRKTQRQRRFVLTNTK